MFGANIIIGLVPTIIGICMDRFGHNVLYNVMHNFWSYRVVLVPYCTYRCRIELFYLLVQFNWEPMDENKEQPIIVDYFPQ